MMEERENTQMKKRIKLEKENREKLNCVMKNNGRKGMEKYKQNKRKNNRTKKKKDGKNYWNRRKREK